jgi:hypothetical protein
MELFLVCVPEGVLEYANEGAERHGGGIDLSAIMRDSVVTLGDGLLVLVLREMLDA